MPSDRRIVFTRSRGTSVTFSWRLRVFLSALPAVPLIVFMWGGLGYGPLTWLFGAITAIAIVLWLPHVWTSAPVASLPPADHQTPSPADEFSSAGAAPADLFTWGPSLDTADRGQE
jgi:hypothetical protein